jgi:hypothetical protein
MVAVSVHLAWWVEVRLVLWAPRSILVQSAPLRHWVLPRRWEWWDEVLGWVRLWLHHCLVQKVPLRHWGLRRHSELALNQSAQKVRSALRHLSARLVLLVHSVPSECSEL